LAESIDAPIFVPPNPNDCGLAQGALLFRSRPKTPANVTYSGPAVLDMDLLPGAVARYGAVEVLPSDVAQLLFEGSIVAVTGESPSTVPERLATAASSATRASPA
jgi:predicted NodU family carbamoyl transferase